MTKEYKKGDTVIVKATVFDMCASNNYIAVIFDDDREEKYVVIPTKNIVAENIG